MIGLKMTERAQAMARQGEQGMPVGLTAPDPTSPAPNGRSEPPISYAEVPPCPDSRLALRPARGMALGFGLAALTWAVIGMAIWLIV